MSYQHFAKPEFALKRADELIGLGYKAKALDALHSVITSRKHKNNWTKATEKVMLKFIDLCVELKKGHIAKDGLHQYRNVTQQVPQSLEIVVKYFLDKARDAASEAQQKAETLALQIDDLEQEETTAEQLMMAVSGEESKERTGRILDRELVLPWLRFLWETYRTVLDAIRNNPKLEQLYKLTTDQAFQFCLKYKRTNEFRRLSELLRTHLSNMSKHYQVQLDQESTVQFQLEIRLAQLNTAADLELWQEAFRSVEDINGILQISKKTPPPEMMMNYYEKLAKIFWVSENYVFHALSLIRYYELARVVSKDAFDETKTKEISTQILLAALSIPPQGQEQSEYFLGVDVQRDNNTKMAQLLGFTDVEPRRDAVLGEIVAKDLHKSVFPEVETLYTLLEEKFAPLQLATALQGAITSVGTVPALQQYAKTLTHWGSVRLIEQLSDVYQTLKFDRLLKMLPFLTRHQLEKLVVHSVRERHIEARVDHKNGALIFTTQSFETEKVRYRLTEIANKLQLIETMINPDRKRQAQESKKQAFAEIAKEVEKEHDRLMARRGYIESLKQARESKQEAERRKQLEREKLAREAAEEAEKERIRKKAQEREAKVAAAKALEQRLTERKAVIDRLKEIAPLAAADFPAPESVPADMDTATFVEQQVKKIVGERERQQKKLRELSERQDHMARARREAELPLVQEQIKKKSEEDKTYWKSQIQTYLDNHKKTWEVQVAEKRRVAKMQADRKAFEEKITARRREQFAAADKQRQEAVAKARVERDARRKQEEAKRAAEQAERQKAEEAAAAKRAEEEEKRAQAREEAARKAAERPPAFEDREEEERQQGPWRRQNDFSSRPGAGAGQPSEQAWRRPGPSGDERPAPRPGMASADEGRWRRDGPRDRDEPREERPREDNRPPMFRREDRGDAAPRGDSWRDSRPPRDGGDRPPRDFGDRPPRDGGDRPPRDFGDRPPRDSGDRPPRDFGDRPPRRDFGDRPPRDGDRPPRDFGDRPPRGDTWRDNRPPRDGGDRPPRDFGDRPPRDGGDRPPRDFGDRPPRDGGDRPPRDFGDRPPRGGAGGGGGGGGDNWRRPRDNAPRENAPRGDAPKDSGDDGSWTQVKKR